MSSTKHLMQPSYFTCVLSEALEYNRSLPTTKTYKTSQGLIYEHQEFDSITEYVDFLGKTHGHRLAVGCITPLKASSQKGSAYVDELLTFADVVKESIRVSHYFHARLGSSKPGRCCVALVASSSVIFMLTWLGLIRLGYEVMLIAPQSSPESVRHLSKISHTFALCCDDEHEQTILETVSLGNDLQVLKIPWASFQLLREFDIAPRSEGSVEKKKQTMGCTAFYFHSSGTTGLPKLIPQTHNGAVGILPKLHGAHSSDPHTSTFTSTPLYHGGIADLLRCWSAASPVWLFPEGKIPIIGHTVSKILDRIDEISVNERNFPASRLGYLSCVPYVLDVFSKTPELKHRLCSLDAVGVGGASMPQELGDELTASGVRLVSRFGSSECGFLLSSQRDYETDHLWNVHRNPDPKGLRFAPLSNGQYELIVTEEWPLVSTAEHANRPFNTHDVFIPHQNIAEGWQYVGRSDSQLTLSTGKKFDPTNMEHMLRQTVHIEDVVIIGDDQPFASAIIFASNQTGGIQLAQRDGEIWSSIEKINGSVPPHARLKEGSFVVLDMEQYGRVRKNAKGGISRRTFISDFEKELSNIYGSTDEDDGNLQALHGPENMVATVTSIVQSALGSTSNITSEDDLFDHGVDSVLSLQIRKRICDTLPTKLRSQIPLQIVYECGSISAIARYISSLSAENTGNSFAEGPRRTKHEEMEDLVDKYVSAQAEMLEQTTEQANLANSPSDHGISIILTGCTGFLGVHLLQLLLKDVRISTIFLCVRASDKVSDGEQEEQVRARVHSTLADHKMLCRLPDQWEAKVVYIPFTLKDRRLGIPQPLYGRLASETTHVIHAAWEVNFNLPIKTFASQIEGAINLFNVALLASRQRSRRPASFLFCSSVASVANMMQSDSATNVPVLSKDPSDAVDLGYGQSKWVTENVLAKLNQRYPGEVAISILRIGQLSGDTLNGIWNLREAWPLMLEVSLKVFGISPNDATGANTASSQKGGIIFPDLAETTLPPLDWLPVDCAAQKIWRNVDNATAPSLQVLNVTNEGFDSAVTWLQAQEWISAWAESRHLHVVVMSPDEWLDKLESLPSDYRAKALVPLWRKNWVPVRRAHNYTTSGDVLQGNGHVKGREQPEVTPCSSWKRSADVEVETGGYVIGKEYFWRLLDWVSCQ